MVNEMVRKTWILMVVAACVCLSASAQRDENFKYMRGSLYMMMVEHPTLQYNEQIEAVFKKMEIPERFNNHDLGVRVISFANDDNQLQNIKVCLTIRTGNDIALIPQALILIVVNYIDRFADKPTVSLIG